MTEPTPARPPLESQYLNCIRCGLCLSVCPTYREHLNETASPRGRVALTRKSLEGELERSSNLVEQMYSCFACMAWNLWNCLRRIGAVARRAVNSSRIMKHQRKFWTVKTDGNDEAAVLREIESVAAICRQCGARQIKVARDEAERSKLWKARRSVPPALARKTPNKLGEDITVPRNAIPEAIRGLKLISRKYGPPIVIFGHAGDGNLHPNILFDTRNAEQWTKVEQMVAEEFALALDPLNILNPGKVFPD